MNDSDSPIVGKIEPQAARQESDIFEKKDYIDSFGRMIEMGSHVSGPNPGDQFVGTAMTQPPGREIVRGENGKPTSVPRKPEMFRFPIPGVKTITEAFQQFDAAAEKFLALISEEAKRRATDQAKPGIIDPTGMPASAISGLNSGRIGPVAGKNKRRN